MAALIYNIFYFDYLFSASSFLPFSKIYEEAMVLGANEW